MTAGARLLPFATGAPAWNMAVDEAVLHEAPGPTLRLYGWNPPAISLGRFQALPPEGDPLRTSGLPIVRRMTGGGAIVHWHEVTYSLCLPRDHPMVRGTRTWESYDRIHAPVREALRELGVPAAPRGDLPRSSPPDAPPLCFSRVTRLDLVVGDRKLVGSAQRRIQGRLLQHGSIVLRTNPLQPGTAALEALAPGTAATALLDALGRAFGAALGGLEPGRLTPLEVDRSEKAAPAYLIA